MTNYISLNTNEAMALKNIKDLINEDAMEWYNQEKVDEIMKLLRKIDSLVVYED